MAHPQNPAVNTVEIEANKEVGYSANNPEPISMKDSTKYRKDNGSLHSAEEYINGAYNTSSAMADHNTTTE